MCWDVPAVYQTSTSERFKEHPIFPKKAFPYEAEGTAAF